MTVVTQRSDHSLMVTHRQRTENGPIGKSAIFVRHAFFVPESNTDFRIWSSNAEIQRLSAEGSAMVNVSRN